MDAPSDQTAIADSGPVPSATHNAYMTLRQMIVTGELKPRERLKIGELQVLLKTGASPIREALSLLTSDSLVERFDQRGFRAAPINQANFEEILSLRCALEDKALRQSLDNRSEEWEERLVLCHYRMVRAQERGNSTFEELHKGFHMMILANCGGLILIRFCSQLYDLNIRYRYLAGSARDYGSRDVKAEHENILDAVLAGDAELASECLVSHYRRTGAFVRGMLEEMELG